MLAPISKRQEEREFVVDSGAPMHMMSKKDLNSEESWTVNRSRTQTVVFTANGEVHTHEEAQVFVLDLNRFVTVQLLVETPAVQSQGKLCKDHGYSNEWVSGQEPRLTQNGKSIFCKTDNFVPLVVPGSSSPYIATTGIVENRSRPSIWKTELHRAHLQVQHKGEVTNLPPGDWCRNPWRMTRRMRTIRLRDLPFWLEDFTDYLEATEVHAPAEVPAPAHISQDSDSDHSTKVATTSR